MLASIGPCSKPTLCLEIMVDHGFDFRVEYLTFSLMILLSRYAMQSAVMRLHVVYPSVCPSVSDAEVCFSHTGILRK